MCNCNTHMDIRGRCDPKRDTEDFVNCRARVDTAYFHLMNEYDTYRAIESHDDMNDKCNEVIKFMAAKYCIRITDRVKYEVIDLLRQDNEN